MGFSCFNFVSNLADHFNSYNKTPFPISLTSLDISHSRIISDDIKLLSYLTNLRDLKINGVTAEPAINELCNSLPRLQSLECQWVDNLQFSYAKRLSIKHSVLSSVNVCYFLLFILEFDSSVARNGKIE